VISSATPGRALAFALGAALVLAGALPAPAEPARADGPPGGPPTIALAGLDRAWVPVGGAFTLRLDVQAADPALEIALVAHQAITSRSSFEETLQGNDLGSVLGPVSAPLAAVPRDSDGAAVLAIGLQGNGPRDAARLPVRGPGVYPVEVELRQPEGDTLSEFVLPLVVVAVEADGTTPFDEQLRVAWVWPLQERPALRPDGTPDPAVVTALGPEGRIGRQATALATAPDVAVTLAPSPETLEAWATLSANDPALGVSYADASAVLQANQVLAGPYVPLDIPSLLAAGLERAVGAELSHGQDVLTSLLGARIDTGTALPGAFDGATLVRLRDALVDRMIVPGDALEPRASDLTPAAPFLLESEGQLVTALGTDPGVDRLLTGDAPPALRAQQLLATLAVIASEAPNRARGVGLLNPRSWAPEPELLTALLSGLSQHPLLRSVDVDTLLDEIPLATDEPGGAPVVRALTGRFPPPPPVTAAQLDDARGEVAGLATLMGAGDPQVERGERAVQVAPTSAWPGDGRRRARAELQVIDDAVTRFVARIKVPTSNQTITLTSEAAEIPLTLLNETGRTVTVRVTLASDQLSFPDGMTREVELPPRSTTIGFAVESAGSGTFPLELQLTSTDGRIPISSTEVRVRSTFVGGVGLILTIGASVFLALWWLFHFRSRRRSRRARPEATNGAAAPAPVAVDPLP